MRLLFRMLAVGFALAAVPLSAPLSAQAAPRHDHRLTIAAAPNPIIAGEGVLIYGQLNGTNVAGQAIRLYHRVVPASGFTLIGTTTTDANGFYEFTREEGVVESNRFWFVRGPDGSHSRTIKERVAALVSIGESANTSDTAQPLSFTGTVTPSHPGQRVLLQSRLEDDSGWATLATTRTAANSSYTFSHVFRQPGVRDVRVVFLGDARNIRGESDPLAVTIQQAQVPGFTINTTSPVIAYGQQATISGVLDRSGSTAPAPGVALTLWGRPAGTSHFAPITPGTTGSDGSYSFQVSPVRNEVYFVGATLNRKQVTAKLFESVRDVVSLSSSASSGAEGSTVTLSGNVLPDKSGRVVYLQRLGQDGAFHTVAATELDHASGYSFTPTLDGSGSETFRVRIWGDGLNAGSVSPTVTETVTGSQPAGSLPPGS